ncbi:MAG: hypothetical protein LLG08_04025 [Actinomycetia bacterium]|nr:hypothetical protein [Actinomycetes bacterium]
MPSVFELSSSVPQCLEKVTDLAMKKLREAADIGRNAVVTNLSGSRSGIRYKVPGTQTFYTASAPGEYPAVATGNLRQSVKILREGDAFLIGTDVEYGLCLEKKSPSAGGREWLRPSLEGVRPEMEDKVKEAWF